MRSSLNLQRKKISYRFLKVLNLMPRGSLQVKCMVESYDSALIKRVRIDSGRVAVNWRLLDCPYQRQK